MSINDDVSPGAPWDPRYQAAGPERLWPDEPTIRWLDLEAWHAAGVRTVLDAGCGDGKNLAALVRSGFHTIGADLSETALAQCAMFLRTLHFDGRYEFLPAGPLEHIGMPAGAVDAAICIDVLGHLPKPRPVLEEVARLIGAGGFLYASVFHPDDGSRLGPRMRSGNTSTEGWYLPSSPDAAHTEYYFCYYSQADAEQLFSLAGFEMVSLEPRTWFEPPHTGYRDEPHVHVSWFCLLRRR
ncbi:MAG: SAM-dependent methyltransferase [Gemmatimonadetes bacterium]|nr:SAM-dependent methyltransferase [Gemmatimonadota bacterium]